MKSYLLIALLGLASAPLKAQGPNCPEGTFTDDKGNPVEPVDDKLFKKFYEKDVMPFNPVNELTKHLPGNMGEIVQKLEDWELILLPNTEIVSVGQYLEEFNTAAKCMALEYGHDLLSAIPLREEFAEFLQTAEEVDKMVKQAEAIISDIKHLKPAELAEKYGKDIAESYLKNELAKAIDLENNPSLKALYAEAEAYKDLASDLIDPIPVPSIKIRNDLDSKTHKEWRATFGKKAQLRAEASATFDIAASKSEAQVVAKADAFVNIFDSKDIPVLQATAIIDAPATGEVAVNSTFWIAGIALKPYKASVDILDVHDEIEHVIVDVYNQFWFSIGPIPVSVTLGASGTAGVSWGLYANGISASAKVSPHIFGEAYLEAAADIVIAAIGAGGSLTIIDASADLKAGAFLDFEPDGTPFVVNKVTGNTTLTLLAGRIYSFVEIPTPAPPFFQRFERSLYDFKGIVVPLPGLAINFAKKGMPGGQFSIEGEADPVDIEGVNIDNTLSQTLTRIEADMEQAIKPINDESTQSLQILNAVDLKMDDLVAKVRDWK